MSKYATKTKYGQVSLEIQKQIIAKKQQLRINYIEELSIKSDPKHIKYYQI